MKKIIITLLLTSILAVVWLSYSKTGKRILSLYLPKNTAQFELSSGSVRKVDLKAKDAKAFARKHRYNADYCFLIDMSLPSNQKRFFIYDLQKDTILNSGLVTHGRCNEQWLEGRKYDNTPGCGCTSLGKYKVGYSYTGKFGRAFKLYGLEKTNDKAFERFVVLHAHDCVPETEVSNDICQSDGCPTVSPGFLNELQPLISNSKKPVLLWVFN